MACAVIRTALEQGLATKLRHEDVPTPQAPSATSRQPTSLLTATSLCPTPRQEAPSLPPPPLHRQQAMERFVYRKMYYPAYVPLVDGRL